MPGVCAVNTQTAVRPPCDLLSSLTSRWRRKKRTSSISEMAGCKNRHLKTGFSPLWEMHRKFRANCRVVLHAKESDLNKHSPSPSQGLFPVRGKRQARTDSFASPRNLSVAEPGRPRALHVSERGSIGGVERLMRRLLFKNVIGRHFIGELVAHVGEGPFGLLIDRSHDLSVARILGVVIR